MCAGLTEKKRKCAQCLRMWGAHVTIVLRISVRVKRIEPVAEDSGSCDSELRPATKGVSRTSTKRSPKQVWGSFKISTLHFQFHACVLEKLTVRPAVGCFKARIDSVPARRRGLFEHASRGESHRYSSFLQPHARFSLGVCVSVTLAGSRLSFINRAGAAS